MTTRAFLSAFLLSTAAATTQDVREMTTPTAYGRHHGVDANAISSFIGQGYRLTDIEIDSVAPLRFNATYVQNGGAYASGFWWYYGLTSAQLATYLGNNQARLIDLEAYDDGNGNTRFACVMVPNTGPDQKSWWYYFGVQPATVSTALATHNARLVDFDSYAVGGTAYYLAVMIENTGADHRPFWWYYNVPAATVSASASQNGTRVYALDRRANGNFDAILVDEPATPPWTWWYGLTAAQVTEKLGNFGHRPITYESWLDNGERRFAMVTINNSNALTTAVGQSMRATTDGTVGCYLRAINGGELAGLNEHRVFEPASTMKTLHHVHAMRRVHLGLVNLGTDLPVFTAYSSPTSSCPIDQNQVIEDLTTVLRDMMENSDNARTQAVRAFFGEASINATATALGMTDTELRHRIGCGGEAVANPNDITLYDLGLLHEQVANGVLGGFRDEFYEHMLNSLTWGGIATVIDQEAALLGLSAAAVTSFKAQTSLARKGGSYTLNGAEYRSGFGWIEVPFLNGALLQPREYVIGAFVHGASNGANASTAVSQAVGELLRPTLRQALATWDVVAVSSSVGAGCGVPPMQQTAVGLPRPGTTVTFHADDGHPWSLVLLTFGFSDQTLNGTPLPLALGRMGFPGCSVYNDVVASETAVANGSGDADIGLSIPNSVVWLGTEFFTQYFGFGPGLKASNGRHNVVGW